MGPASLPVRRSLLWLIFIVGSIVRVSIHITLSARYSVTGFFCQVNLIVVYRHCLAFTNRLILLSSAGSFVIPYLSPPPTTSTSSPTCPLPTITTSCIHIYVIAAGWH